MLDLQPISLTRLLDGLSDNGLIERRPDPEDRRAKRLYLTPAARPLLERLSVLGEELSETAFAGIDPAEEALLLARLNGVMENLRRVVQRKQPTLDKRYG